MAVMTILTSLYFNSLGDVHPVLKNNIMGLFRIFPTTLFVLLGYMMKEKIQKLSKLDWRKRGAVLFVLSSIQLILCLIWNEFVDLQVYILGNPLLYFVKSLNGSLLILLLSQGVRLKLLTSLGRRTKELMILHHPPFYYTAVISNVLNRFFSPNLLGLIIIFMITVSFCCLIDEFLREFKIWQIMMGRE